MNLYLLNEINSNVTKGAQPMFPALRPTFVHEYGFNFRVGKPPLPLGLA